MVQNADAISFVRNRLKYTTTKCYVGAISAGAISNLWRTINETEFFGTPYTLYSGNINIDLLRAAFLREMSYNPMRFEGVDLTISGKKYPPRTAEIVNFVNHILNRFASIWPNGIVHQIRIVDTSDVAYVFLRDLRDCFKLIARQNVADLKQGQYRDEIIARFATATDINMGADMRNALMQLADASASRRQARRDITDLSSKIGALETQIQLHRNHDREFCIEMQEEVERLKALLECAMATARKPVRPRRLQTSKSAPQPAAPLTGGATVPWIDEDEPEYISEAAEREHDLLLSMTPDHITDEVFQDYVEQMVGLKLTKCNNQNQR